jgi:hypothetical protein
MRSSWISILFIVSLPAQTVRFEPGPLTIERLRAAVAAAGFDVRELSATIPKAVHSRFPFTPMAYDDPQLVSLRKKYQLEEVVSKARDEWSAQLILKQWIAQRIPGGNPRSSPTSAEEILDRAANGERFYCTQYAITYAECAQALGWQARKIGVDRKHGPIGMGSTHHGVAEVWSNQFGKWVVMDPQSNLHFEKKGVPLNAWEIRAEWLRNGGADVDHVVGIPPVAIRKNPAIVWWKLPDEDETATYYWLYIEDHVARYPDSKYLLPLDQAHDGVLWYQNEDGNGRLHTGYLRNRFVPTRRLEDAYWTVSIPEARLVAASAGVVRMSVETYDPNRTGHESSLDGRSWERIADEKALAWTLKPDWNMLRLRVTGRRGITGPEAAIVMFLSAAEPLKAPR